MPSCLPLYLPYSLTSPSPPTKQPTTKQVITTVAGLRTKHGEGSFWGDLNHVETRLVYHQLLPRHLLQVGTCACLFSGCDD